MSVDATTAYFDDIVARVATAPVVIRDLWSEAEPAKCHQNCMLSRCSTNGMQLPLGSGVMSIR